MAVDSTSNLRGFGRRAIFLHLIETRAGASSPGDKVPEIPRARPCEERSCKRETDIMGIAIMMERGEDDSRWCRQARGRPLYIGIPWIFLTKMPQSFSLPLQALAELQ